MITRNQIKRLWRLRGKFKFCLICKKEFYAIPGNIRKGKGKYCSRKCYGLARSIFAKGNTNGFKKGMITWNKGKKYLQISGEKHWNWKGGVGSRPIGSFEYKLWRKSIFERDNYTCVFCGKKGVYLEADHIKPWALFPELHYDIKNGRTLCKPCHKTTRIFFGNKYVKGDIWENQRFLA